MSEWKRECFLETNVAFGIGSVNTTWKKSRSLADWQNRCRFSAYGRVKKKCRETNDWCDVFGSKQKYFVLNNNNYEKRRNKYPVYAWQS